MADQTPIRQVQPMVRLDLEDATNAPALAYDLPDPTSFPGRSYITLDFGSLDPFSTEALVTSSGQVVQPARASVRRDQSGEIRIVDLDGVVTPIRNVQRSGVVAFTTDRMPIVRIARGLPPNSAWTGDV